jgi:hypothetical protein
MTTFDKREQAFEAEFVRDEETRFKAVARRNKLLGNWTATNLGLAGDAAIAYADALVVADLELNGGEDALRKVLRDLRPNGISEKEVVSRMQEFLGVALAQIKAGE